MQSGNPNFPGEYGGGGGGYHGVELQPSGVCPKNFIIFDQNDHKSRIMYHPVWNHKFAEPGYGTEKIECCSSSMKEDTKDIDALMSLEEDEVEEEDDEVISTARTYGNYGCSSPDSCSSSFSRNCKSRVSSMKKSLSGYCNDEDDEKQRKRMKKMVKALRRIVPGADKMSNADLIDEAVTYLKSLKVEVKNMGLDNFNN